MSLQDGQVADDDHHDTEGHVRPGMPEAYVVRDIELGGVPSPASHSLLRRAWSSPSTTGGAKSWAVRLRKLR